MTSQDEWYKAAYYKGGGAAAGYWLYPTSSNTAPGRDMADASGNNANYYTTDYLIGRPYYRTEVGEFENSDSPYGTFDQGGNVWELNESIISGTYRGLRSGSAGGPGGSVYDLQASSRGYYGGNPPKETFDIGFRVSGVVVPEPSSLLALGSGILALAGVIRRRR